MRRPQPQPRKPGKNTNVTPSTRRRRYHPVDLEPIEVDMENPDWLVGAN
jgi:hypothetical protein